MNTIAATTSRVPRPVVIAIVALATAFVALMIVRVGVFGGSSDSTSATPVAPSTPATTPAQNLNKPARAPKIVLLPGLPATVAHALRYSKVAVVSLYVGQAPGDRAVVAQVRKGARSTGAGFVAINVGSDKQAATVASFAGSVSAPSMLVVRRPGKIMARFSGPVDSAVIAQAAHNAGARR